MKIFISGPMTGLPDYNRKAFNDTASELREQGYEVFNPAELEAGHTHDWYMSRCLEALHKCEILYQLEGWNVSKGARIEYEEAIKTGIKIKTASVKTVRA